MIHRKVYQSLIRNTHAQIYIYIYRWGLQHVNDYFSLLLILIHMFMLLGSHLFASFSSFAIGLGLMSWMSLLLGQKACALKFLKVAFLIMLMISSLKLLKRVINICPAGVYLTSGPAMVYSFMNLLSRGTLWDFASFGIIYYITQII